MPLVDETKALILAECRGNADHALDYAVELFLLASKGASAGFVRLPPPNSNHGLSLRKSVETPLDTDT